MRLDEVQTTNPERLREMVRERGWAWAVEQVSDILGNALQVGKVGIQPMAEAHQLLLAALAVDKERREA